VKVSEIESPIIQKIISDMKKALATQDDGVAIAAPQIGVSLRIFVVSHKVFELFDDEGDNERPLETGDSKDDLVFINPEILKLSRDKKWVEEGCLSVRWLYGKVSRSKKAKIKAYNEHGTPFVMGASGLLAQVFQHETDHLNGVLFIDKAKDIEEIPPEKVREVRTKRS
jgi:peptide deformylase